MTVSSTHVIFGIHQATFINRSDGLPYGTIKALGDATFDTSREAIKLFGGSSPNPWDTQYGNISGELSLTIKEYKPFLWTIAGNTVEQTALSTTGAVSTLTNIGTPAAPVMHATTGIASVLVLAASKASLKAGRYIVKAETATAVGLYAYTDVDGGAGTALPLLDDTNLVTASPFLTISTAGTKTELAALGIEFAGGSGTIGMTVGATAYFDVIPVNAGGSVRIHSGSAPVPVACGLVLTGQKLSNGGVDMSYFPNITVDSVPQGYGEKKHTEGDIKVSVNLDATLGYAWEKKWVSRA